MNSVLKCLLSGEGLVEIKTCDSG